MRMSEACAHAEAGAHGLTGAALATALDRAEVRCAQQGERLTGPRRRVLELLLEAGQPTKAYDLIAAYGEDGVPAKPPTVYRALGFLERLGFAHRIESLNAYVPCRMEGEGHQAAFLICDCCGDTREIEPPGGVGLRETAAGSGYELERVTIEAHGRCAACARTA